MYKTKQININDDYAFIKLGRAGENMFRALQIYIPDGIDENAEYRIIYSRPDGITYPVEITRRDNFIIWTPDAYDTELAGEGYIEVREYHGEIIGKSATFKVEIDESIQADETQPGIARPDWVDDIIDKVTISEMKQTVASTESGGVNTFTVTLTNGESSAFRVCNGAQGEKGDTGEKGERGNDGADGYTPQRGVDYWTEEDKAETVSTVLEEAENSTDTKLKSYVKRTDFSSGKGIVMASTVSDEGTTYTPQIYMATTTDIKGLTHQYRPIVPANLVTSVDVANNELGMAKKTYVDSAVSKVEAKIPDVSGFVTTEEFNSALGDIEAALDKIIALQNSLIGGDTA